MALSTETEVTSSVRGGPTHVVPTGAALGATVKGVDLRDLEDIAFARIMQGWHDHSVLLVRGQTLSDRELIAFGRRFGNLDWAPIQDTGRHFVEGLPEIWIVSNVKVKGEPIGSLGDGEAMWHTDMSYLDLPPKASMLYALEVPPTGGNTSFCTMYGIYDSLPAKLKERIDGLCIKHDGTYTSGGYVRQGIVPTDDAPFRRFDRTGSARQISGEKIAKWPFADEANSRRVLLRPCRDAFALRDGADVALRDVAQREQSRGKLFLVQPVEKITLVLGRVHCLSQFDTPADAQRAHVVPGCDPIRAEGARVVEERAKLDFTVA